MVRQVLHLKRLATSKSHASANRDTDVAIWAFKEWDGHPRTQSIGDPMITTIGSYIETHPRHYRQQSTYTVCMEQADSAFYFTPHDRALDVNPEDHRMKKYILSGKDRGTALKDLHSMNITDYSIYGSEESLMRMLAYQEIVLNR